MDDRRPATPTSSTEARRISIPACLLCAPSFMGHHTFRHALILSVIWRYRVVDRLRRQRVVLVRGGLHLLGVPGGIS
eukprot:46334-Eustigmatos_ZCMA.PRE.1